jgi:hypothetical protein
MKQRFNAQISTLTRVDEVNLFRLMANLFNTNISSSTFVDEVHGHKGYIDYFSPLRRGIKKIEIADLLLITCNRSNNEIRLCFLQAKYRRGSYRSFLTFVANLYQWELLKDKPDIIDRYNKGFPENILNFSDYQSITSFGIFYKDRSGYIDFLYTLPEHITRRNKQKYQTMDFFVSCHCPNVHCTKGLMRRETISTCSIDIFEREVLECRIGAPITSYLRPYLAKLLNSMRINLTSENFVLNELIGRLDSNIYENLEKIFYPNTIIILTNGHEHSA